MEGGPYNDVSIFCLFDCMLNYTILGYRSVKNVVSSPLGLCH